MHRIQIEMTWIDLNINEAFKGCHPWQSPQQGNVPGRSSDLSSSTATGGLQAQGWEAPLGQTASGVELEGTPAPWAWTPATL